jgi:hypothetical protein
MTLETFVSFSVSSAEVGLRDIIAAWAEGILWGTMGPHSIWHGNQGIMWVLEKEECRAAVI